MSDLSRASRASLARQLAPLKYAFLGVEVLIVVVSIAVLFHHPGQQWAAISAGAFGIATTIAAAVLPAATLRPLPADTPDPAQVASGRIRSAAFVTLALSESPALVGLAMAFVGDGWLPAVVGGTIAVLATSAFGPSEFRISQWIERLESGGARTGL